MFTRIVPLLLATLFAVPACSAERDLQDDTSLTSADDGGEPLVEDSDPPGDTGSDSAGEPTAPPELLLACDLPVACEFPVELVRDGGSDGYAASDLCALAALADAGQLFLTDYSILEGVPAGTWDQGRRRKYLWAPLGLFAWLPAHGSRPAGLMPIAVQCFQQHDPVEAPLFGPFDGVKWQMAKMVLQVADTHDHGIVRHLGLCHIIMEAVTVCLFRNLAPAHPLRVLLTPHVAFTLATNEITQDSTINPGGVTVTFQSNTFAGTFMILHRALEGFDWDTETPAALQIERVGPEVESVRESVAPELSVARQLYALGDFVHQNLKFFLGFGAAPPTNGFLPPADMSAMGAAADERRHHVNRQSPSRT
mgnify:CR=1 FL=1